MATYAIGDIQGCYAAFRALLELIGFNPERDRLWLVGDIVNRGPDSLNMLRFAMQADDSVAMVLGNHDLHLLMVHADIARSNNSDTIQPILDAEDCESMLSWLRHQRLFYAEDDYAMVHAGLLPGWSISRSLELAAEVERALQRDNYREIFARLYGNEPDYWCDNWKDSERLRVIINAMTRMRVCSPAGRMNFSYKGTLDSMPDGYMPWFEVPDRVSRNDTIICGHWSALGLYVTENIIALDSGCVWNGRLSAIRLEDRKVFQIQCGTVAAREC
ncbi:MAG: symmetrical bis(5'-nucleosyl)-tetraphosphatase [Nitrosomonas sp.]|nr:symmetrical bis(5'-nucleosyl)-tetraphosphatase [Nitrosomonas sp.]